MQGEHISSWCTKKNSMKDLIEKGIDFNPALLPCLKTKSHFYIGKNERLIYIWCS
jgi:hypothetical protein